MKLPSLVRRMSVQAVREESLQQRRPRNEFERKILLDVLPEATEWIEYFYGARFKSLPSVLVSNRVINPDKQAWSEYLKELQSAGFISEQRRIEAEQKNYPEKPKGLFKRFAFAMSQFARDYYSVRISLKSWIHYSPGLESIHIPTKEMLRSPFFSLYDSLSHELTHHLIWEKRSPINSVYSLPSSLHDRALALSCAEEGLATYCMSGAREQPPMGFLARIKNQAFEVKYYVEKAFMNTLVYPQRFLADITYFLLSFTSVISGLTAKFCRRQFWDTPEKLVKALESSSLARKAVSPYLDGLRFVREVSAALGGPKEAFKAITEKPPETMQEILLPEQYLSRIKSA